MTQKFATFLLTKVFGYRTIGELPPEKKVIFLAAPHTSIWDAMYGYLYFRTLGERLKIMIKKEAFFWPAGWIIRSIGGFPVDRSHPQNMMMDLIHEMQKDDKFYLAICPEGSRKPVKKWKTGYHTIAKETGSVVYLTTMDYKKKYVGITEKFDLTDNARVDTERIQKIYESYHVTPCHPDGAAY